MQRHDAVLAFDVGGTTIKAEVLGPGLTPWAATREPTPSGIRLVGALARLGDRLLRELPSDRRARVGGVGLVIPGIVDPDRGVSLYAANLDLRDAPIAGPLQERIGLPVRLGHDVTAAAEAERRCGAAAGVADPLVVVIGTGIAAVSFAHDRPIRGVSGQAGELGHVVVRPGGPRCGCGASGCLEAVASAAAVVRAYQAATGREVTGALDVIGLLGYDRAADAVWAEATSALADALLLATTLLAPGAIVLGGGLAEAGAALTEPVAARMRERASVVAVPPLLTAALGSRAGVVGAGLLALGDLADGHAPNRRTEGAAP